MAKRYKLRSKCNKCGQKVGTNWGHEELKTKQLLHLQDKHGIPISRKETGEITEETEKARKEHFT